jgi:hypothetical protein
MSESIATGFVTLAPDEQRIREYHVVEESAALALLDVVYIVLGLIAGIVPGLIVIFNLMVRPRVSETLTITTERVIHYRKEQGRFHDGHAYANVRMREVSGVTTDHEYFLASERVTILVHTARAEAMVIGTRPQGFLAKIIKRNNLGPDAERALRELPSLFPALRAGDVRSEAS